MVLFGCLEIICTLRQRLLQAKVHRKYSKIRQRSASVSPCGVCQAECYVITARVVLVRFQYLLVESSRRKTIDKPHRLAPRRSFLPTCKFGVGPPVRESCAGSIWIITSHVEARGRYTYGSIEKGASHCALYGGDLRVSAAQSQRSATQPHRGGACAGARAGRRRPVAVRLPAQPRLHRARLPQ